MTETQRSWLLLAAGDSRQHAGNTGYQDQLDAYYSWDDTVAHHAEIRDGDRVAIWDKSALIGISVIDEIVVGIGEKVIRKCPRCKRASIKARVRTEPTFRCFSCEHVFDDALEHIRSVKTFRALYESSWIDLSGTLGGPELRNSCYSKKSQQSLRPLNWRAFAAALSPRVPQRLAERINISSASTARDGHQLILTRARRGQSQFRSHLLNTFGETCAIMGPCPSVTLEAAHLYSYAQYGKHFEYGGLLLRRDVHRLFDRGDVAIHPISLRVDVDPYVSTFENYRDLHGKAIQVPVGSRQVSWLQRHWSQHRALLLH